MVLVVVGVCIVGLAAILFAIPANKPIAFPAAVTTARQGPPGAAVVKLARARTPHTAARSRGGRAGEINP
jgi:hypothetical protein